ncbi:thermonuclease family protein [Yinghuangia seranimata]|uniref:thermonuclease family protein n=1 Tax=Yinghuangia seranimata TaxID=408067 RepID=UPI00248AC144|nr:hypothetical protein [Yinghuangia seranimata]MDI2130005.1 hypothetical protein [Yinghuangia seranimata]
MTTADASVPGDIPANPPASPSSSGAPAAEAAAPARVPAPKPGPKPGPPRVPAPAKPPVSAQYQVIAGELLVVGKQPDGDSVRFRAERPELFKGLAHGERIRPGTDGSVQLRLDGIDAPELHYAGQRQPFGDRSRDAFLKLLGFGEVKLAANEMTVTSAEPPSVPGVILARMAEVHGRPVAFLFTGDAAKALHGRDGGTVTADAALLAGSANFRMLASGDAYPLQYTSTAPELRKAIVAAASKARAAHLGVYAMDSSSRFSVVDQNAVGPGGDLVFPKFFRRVTDWLRESESVVANESATGLAGPAPLTLPAWLRANPGHDDRVQVGGGRPQPLHTLLHQTGSVVTTSADLFSLVFVEQ